MNNNSLILEWVNEAMLNFHDFKLSRRPYRLNRNADFFMKHFTDDKYIPPLIDEAFKGKQVPFQFSWESLNRDENHE